MVQSDKTTLHFRGQPQVHIFTCASNQLTTNWLWVIDSTSSPFLLPGNQGMGLKVLTLLSWLVLLATNPYPWVLSISHLININPFVVEMDLLWITKYLFHLNGSEAISGTEDQRPNVITKDVLLLLLLRKFQGFGDLWARKDQIYIYYK